MLPDALSLDSIYVFVFGPGFGECTAVHIPSFGWIVVDSCRIEAKCAASHLLEKYGGKCECLILTHLHKDHYDGFADLADVNDWRLIGCNDPNVGDDFGVARSPQARTRVELDQAIATIRKKWIGDTSKEWRTWRGKDQMVGSATIRILHPPEPSLDQRSNPNRNQTSCPILIDWCGVRVLLAADLQNPHWEEIAAAFPNPSIGEHVLLKVPHHGSRNALSDAWMNGSRDRNWVVTPWTNGGRKLPQFADGGPIAEMLTRVDRLYVTSLPTRVSQAGEIPHEVERQDVANHLHSNRGNFALSSHVRGRPLLKYDELNSFVAFEIQNTGESQMIACGAGSLALVENLGACV